MIYKICPVCGERIDPGERCDCEREGRRGMDESPCSRGSAAEPPTAWISARLLTATRCRERL